MSEAGAGLEHICKVTIYLTESYVSGFVLLLAAVWIIAVHGLPQDFLTRNDFNLAGFLGTVSAAALWQIAYAPYVSDYSRYMPEATGARPAFWASYWGCCALGTPLSIWNWRV